MKSPACLVLAICLLLSLPLSYARASDPDWPGVIAQLRGQLTGAPENSDLRRELAIANNNYAVALSAEQQWDLAAFCAEEAVRLNPDVGQFRASLAQIYLRHAQDRYRVYAGAGNPAEDAAVIFDLTSQALAASPGLVPAHVLLGDLEYTRGNRDAAAIAWWRAKALAPDLPGFAERLALVQEGPDGDTASVQLPGASVDLVQAIKDLRKRYQRAPDDVRLRRQLAEAQHRYGLALAENGDRGEALGNLTSASRLAPEIQRYRQGLARTSLGGAVQLRRELGKGSNTAGSAEEAKRLVEQAIEADPGFALAYVVLGDIAYDAQQLDQAQQAWHKAKELDPGLEGLNGRFSRLTREYAAETGMKSIQGYDFVLRYEEDVADSFGFDVRDRLSRARRVVGQSLNHWPRRRIVVLLYSMGTYRRVRQQAPAWSAGLYDGKIRIPLPGTSADIAAVEGTIVHEYVHAVVHDLTGGNCPAWLNEGLAELYEAEYSTRDALAAVRIAARNRTLLHWQDLDRHFQSATAAGALRAYDQAHSMVAYLQGTYGTYRLRRVLDTLGAGGDITSALTREFSLTPAELEHGWRRWLGGAG